MASLINIKLAMNKIRKFKTLNLIYVKTIRRDFTFLKIKIKQAILHE